MTTTMMIQHHRNQNGRPQEQTCADVRYDDMQHCQQLTMSLKSTSRRKKKSLFCSGTRSGSDGSGFVSRSIIFITMTILYWSTTLLSFCSARDCHTSFRRAWRDLSCQEQDDFLEAVTLVKDSGIYDEFIDVHLEVASLTHGPAAFLPWHRWFLWNFEKALQEATGTCIYVPYWDWERDAEWESESDLMHSATFGTWGSTSGAGCTVDGITSYHQRFRNSPGIDYGPNGCVTRNFLGGFSFAGEAQVIALITNYDQFADTTGNAIGTDQSNPPETGSTNGFRTEFEHNGHMLVHGITGGHMGTNWSPADPLFWLHHSNVDRIWGTWQDYWDHDECSTDEYYAPWHYDSEWALDRRLPFMAASSVSSWDFRMAYSAEEDSGPAFPTVRDVMTNDGPDLSVRYMNSNLNNLIPGYTANPRLFQVATDFVGVKCNRDKWEWTRRRNLEEEEQQQKLAEEESSRSTTGDASATSILMNQTDLMSTGTHDDENQIKFPHFFRSSLRGDDAQSIEDDADSYFRTKGDGRVESNLDLDQSDIVDVNIAACAHPPVFTLQETRDEWNRLCRELPASTSVADRLALLAKSDCNRKGNPRSDAPEIRERISMTMMNAFDGPSSSYECFHRPDRPAGDRRRTEQGDLRF